jgi:hypothetical protein
MPHASKETASHIEDMQVDLGAAAAIEAAEARAWCDMYAAAPPDFAQAAGIGATEVAGALVLRWAATGRRYFSRTVGLGVAEPLTPAALDEILDGYAAAGIDMFLIQSLPHCRPAAYDDWLRERGLEVFDAQDRIVRGGGRLAVDDGASDDRHFVCERVTVQTSEEWSDFLQRVYRLDTGPWMGQLIERDGWHQYVAREEGEIVAARGMYICPDGMAWLGMDGPVPGVMTDDYEPDAALCAFIVADGLARGAQGFLADIEAPSEHRDTRAYEVFAALGFAVPYTRTHYAVL